MTSPATPPMLSHQHQGLIEAHHPSLPGHFPGNPVVPGVVILDEVLQALAQWQPQWRACGFVSVKFLQPLLPGEVFTVQLQQTKADRIKFECKKTQLVFANGIIDIDTP
jgi:3-hydroxyacyl-[acyl-carrier-protein] dehydratase